MQEFDDTNTAATPAFQPVAPPKRRLPRALVIAGLAVVALAAAVAVFLSGGGTQPEDLLPANTVAFAKLDLDPAANQKISFVQFISKLPDTFPKSTSDDPLAGLFDSAGGTSAEWRQIRTWLGDRYAIAAVPVGDDIAAVAVLAVTNEDALRTYLGKHSDGTRLVVNSGYALLAESQSTLDAITASTNHLASNADFRDDVAALPGDQVAVAWMNLEQAAKLGKQADALLGAFAPAASLQDALGDAEGRAVMGLHFTATSAVVTVLGRGAAVSGQQLRDDATTNEVQQLPANTLAALSIAGIGDTIRTAIATNADLKETVQGLGIRADDLAAVFSGPVTLLAIPQGESANVGLLMRPQSAGAATRALHRMLDPLVGGSLPVLSMDAHLVVGFTNAQAQQLRRALADASTVLAGTALFDATVPESGAFVLYVNAMKSIPLLGMTGDTANLGAIGFVARAEGKGNSRATLTVTLQEPQQ